MIKSIVPAGKNASAVLKDPTGELVPANLLNYTIQDYSHLPVHLYIILILYNFSLM